MTKNEFVDRVGQNSGIGQSQAAKVVDAMPSALADGLRADSEVTIDGLGTFSLDEAKEPKFRADPELKKAINK
jgi:nucleoid DNA-binding protein